MIIRDRKSKPIIDFLEKRREEFLPVRDRVRALVAQRIVEGRGTRFEAGVLGVMTGAVTATDRPYFNSIFYEQNGSIVQWRIGHTVLDILKELKAGHIRDFSSSRQRLLKSVDQKMDAIERAWDNVVGGYAELQGCALPHGKVLRPRDPNRNTGI